MDSFAEIALSDAGPRYRVMVYQRMTGIIVWTQPWWMPYWFAKKKAAQIMAKGLKF